MTWGIKSAGNMTRWFILASAQVDVASRPMPNRASVHRTPREPDAAPETGRRAMVTSPARAVPMAPVALWPERIKTLRRVARTCPPSRRAHQAQLGRSRRQAVVVLYSAKHGQRDQLAAPSWRCDQLRVRLRYRMQRL